MAIYTIHAREGGLDALCDARFLRDGFSWAAFLLGPLWLLRHGLFLAVTVWAIAAVILVLAATTVLPADATAAILVAGQVLLGLEADHLLQAKLARTGYRLLDIVAAPTLDEAEVIFFGRRSPAMDKAPPDPEAGR